jgi:hypothetical protein
MPRTKRARRSVIRRIKDAYGYVIWLGKHLYRWIPRLVGPGLFWVFGAWQALMIGRYFTDHGWDWCPAWALAAAIGFTPFLGALAAAEVAAKVGWMPFVYAASMFLAPFWLFAVFSLPARLSITSGRRPRRALRLLRAPRLRRTSDEGVPAAAR